MEETALQKLFREITQARHAINTMIHTDIAIISDVNLREPIAQELTRLSHALKKSQDEIRLALLTEGYRERQTESGLMVIEA